jgi:hypothetical protein
MPLRKAQLFGILERLCERLEPSRTQSDRAKTSYEAVGQWLAAANCDWLSSSSIYLQGSTALGTGVKPIARNEYDIELVFHIPGLERWLPPAMCKQLVGDRLKENQHYGAILEEKPRCWRLNYVNEFHLDITPSIPNSACPNDGELVPDKALWCWKATNPKGCRDAFQRRAELIPRMRVLESFATDAQIEPFPERPRFMGLLCRIVQTAKRHRDTYFLNRDASLSPISVIITTLAAWSYEYCVRSSVFDSELDVMCAVIRHMPNFIERRDVAGQVQRFVWNETTEGENFAERWNAEPARVQAFFDWHAAAMADLERLAKSEGLDRLGEILPQAFGQTPTSEVTQDLFASVSVARRKGDLALAPQVGLTIASTERATPVRANTFYGVP